MEVKDGVLDLTPGKKEQSLEPRSGAETVALKMGLITEKDLGMPGRGRKAAVGQYVKVQDILDKDDKPRTQRLDMSEVINASVKGAIKLPIRELK